VRSARRSDSSAAGAASNRSTVASSLGAQLRCGHRCLGPRGCAICPFGSVTNTTVRDDVTAVRARQAHPPTYEHGCSLCQAVGYAAFGPTAARDVAGPRAVPHLPTCRAGQLPQLRSRQPAADGIREPPPNRVLPARSQQRARPADGDGAVPVGLDRRQPPVGVRVVGAGGFGAGEGVHAARPTSAAINCSPMNSVNAGGMAWQMSSRDIQSMPIASRASSGCAL
jgi:hypothetical protein